MRRMMLLAPLALCVLIAAVLSCTPSAMPSDVALAPTPSTQAMKWASSLVSVVVNALYYRIRFSRASLSA